MTSHSASDDMLCHSEATVVLHRDDVQLYCITQHVYNTPTRILLSHIDPICNYLSVSRTTPMNFELCDLHFAPSHCWRC